MPVFMQFQKTQFVTVTNLNSIIMVLYNKLNVPENILILFTGFNIKYTVNIKLSVKQNLQKYR